MDDKKRSLACDIVMEVPWHCGERDCPVGWHMSNYWLYEDGTYSIDKYADGDHEDCELEDVPSYADYLQAEIDYAWYVHDKERDPLNLFNVPVKRKKKLKCKAWFLKGRKTEAYLVRITIEGKDTNVRVLPGDVRDYLSLIEPCTGLTAERMVVPRTSLPWDELAAAADVKVKGDFAVATFTLDREVSRADTTIERELRRAARRRIKELKAEKKAWLTRSGPGSSAVSS